MPEAAATVMDRRPLMSSTGIAATRSSRSNEGRETVLLEPRSDVVQARELLPDHEAAVTVRELTGTDGAAVDAVLIGLSPQSRYLRFNTGIGQVSGWMRRALADVDGHNCVGVVAEMATLAGPAAIGMAHLCRVDERRAEVAVVVVDAYQRRGVGRRLLETLGERAVDLGYQVIVANVLPENDVAQRFAHQTFPGVLSQRRDDLVELRYHLSVAQDWEAEILSALRCH
jgi:ribosomal protein S18 acetylase RimI-like enzyme